MPFFRKKTVLEDPNLDTEETNLPVHHFFKSKHIMALNQTNFDCVLSLKDVSLVMFFSPTDDECKWSKKQFAKAAMKTKRENHLFAAVDCTIEYPLCMREDIPHVPYFKLYSLGKTIGTFSEARKFLFDDMKTWVEVSPPFK